MSLSGPRAIDRDARTAPPPASTASSTPRTLFLPARPAGFPVAFPDTDHAALADWIGRMLAAASHERGFAHTEFVLTATGPEVVEINARIGGALVGEALCRALGVNAYDAMVQVAPDRRPDLLDHAGNGGTATGFVIVHPRAAGVLEGWTGLDRLTGLPGNPEWHPTASPGDVLRHLTDQRSATGIVLAEGPTAELALHRAQAAAGGIIPVVRVDTGSRSRPGLTPGTARATAGPAP